jgi:hypothetical protein
MDIKQHQIFFFVTNVNTYEVHANQTTAGKASTFLQTHRLSLAWLSGRSGNDTYYSYKDTITNTSTNPPESYEISGVAWLIRSANKNTLDFNGTGFKTTTFTDSNGKKIETTYKVYSRMQGELCKNGNIKIILDEENGQTSKAKIDGQEVDYNDLYSSESNFCLKKVK